MSTLFLLIVVCGPTPCDGGTTILIKKRGSWLPLKEAIVFATVGDSRNFNKREKRKIGEREEVETAELAVFFLLFLARLSLDRVEF